MKQYDLRSDTVTLPTREMRKAMYRADVGDDVYGEDPTVNKLQEMAAKITGKKDALFVPSGSMGNLIPLFVHGGRGSEFLIQENGHILHYELSSAAALAGMMPVAIPGQRGILTPEMLQKHLRPDIYYMPRVSLICIENTHNKEGGTCYSRSELKALYEFSEKNKIPIHLDGARVFNASAATGMSVRRICSYAEIVTFCLSKGLGAPAGSLLCGSAKFIEEARRIRKMLGGGMRQAGILAAAGIYALENNIERLAIDHENAKLLAEALSDTDWAEINLERVETNIVNFKTMEREAEQVAGILTKKGILCSAASPRRIRMVTHLGISREETEAVCAIIRSLKISPEPSRFSQPVQNWKWGK